jgi:hypothetical protein
MKLVNLIPLKEIDFRNQDQFDDYQQKHNLRPDTKVTINGKVTTAGQAAQKTGSSVFGKDKGGDVFSKSDSMATVNSIAAKTGLRAQAVAGWADENGVNLSKVSADIDSKKLKPMDLMTAVVGNPGNKYAKDIIAKYSQSVGGSTDKSITKTKSDKQIDVSSVSKSILQGLEVKDRHGIVDKDAEELANRLSKGDSGVYTRTSPHGGRIVFKDGTKFEVFRPHNAKKTNSTKIYASKR